jgi:CBS domain-containing protein
MDTQQKEIFDFLAQIPPLDQLPGSVVAEVSEKINIKQIHQDTELPLDDETEKYLYILKSGSISLYSSESQLMGKLNPGDICTLFCSESTSEFTACATQKSTLYTIACSDLSNIIKAFPSEIISFIQQKATERLSAAVQSKPSNETSASPLLYTSVEEVLTSPVQSIQSSTSISEAAKVMSNHELSCLLVKEHDRLVGIVSLKDIAKRCVATDLAPSAQVHHIMTSDMVTIERDTFAYDALMIMTREHIRHLPVMDKGTLYGIVTSGDLMRLEGRNSAYLTGAIKKANDINTLIQLSSRVPQLQLQLVKMGATADHVGKGVTAITSAITRRLIELAMLELGPAPAAFAWVACGSQGRREQTSHTDQDNGLILHNDVKETDMPYFAALAKFVCDGLAQCGYIYCPGNIMASNPQWCQTQQVWASYFDQWIRTPSPKALLMSSVFFDLRSIYGDMSLLENIRNNVLKLSQKSTLFLAHLTKNALNLRPPLGFIRDFVLIHDGEHNDTLDLKHNGIAPIVDLARIYALAEGISAVNTNERLKQATGSHSLSADGGANLLDAYEFISSLRTKHQAEQISNGEKADNFVPPKNLSALEREHLKDAFKVIQSMQNSLNRSFRG